MNKKSFFKKNLHNFLSANILPILLIFLVSPILYVFSGNLSAEDKAIYVSICLIYTISLCFLMQMISFRAKRIFYVLLWLISIPGNMVNWSYFFSTGDYISRHGYWVIFQTNMGEAKEYIFQFTDWKQILLVLLYLAFGVVLMLPRSPLFNHKTRHKKLSFKKHYLKFSLAIILIIFIPISRYCCQSIPTYEIYYSGMRYVKYTKKLSTLSENHKNRHWDVSTALSDGTPHTFVIIIGEATSVFHQSIYGYHRQTTPNLDSMRNELIVFENTYAPATSTTASLEKVLSFATRERPDDYMEKPLITELFNDAGFTTYWISKQNIADGWQSGIYVIAAQKANYLFDVSKSPYDDAVLPTLQEALNDTAKNKVIFIHLMGAHIKYKERYPKEFDKFDHKKENLHGKAFQTETMLRTIDEYDNAILYNDYILSRITKILEAQNNTSSYMCFFADHGEEVYDNRPFMGHASRFPVPIEQLRIPLILWQNEAYKAEFPNLTYDTSKEFNTENLIYKIEEWSGIHYK